MPHIHFSFWSTIKNIVNHHRDGPHSATSLVGFFRKLEGKDTDESTEAPVGDKEESTAYRGTIYHYPMIIHDNYIDGITIGDVASGLADGSIDYDSSLKPSDEVEEYYNDYLKRVGITEQEFCDEYLKIDKETYRKCKCVISQMD